MLDYTILVIDYEPKSIQRLRGTLERAGFKVVVAKDGVSGIETFHRIKPDLTLIEAMLPKKHGFEVCQELKKTPHGKASPILIITSVYKGRKYRSQALALGCNEYLEKPLSDEHLLSSVRNHLGVKTEEDEQAAASEAADDAVVIVSDEDNDLERHLDSILTKEPRGSIDEIEPVNEGQVVPFDPSRSRKRRSEAAPGATAPPAPMTSSSSTLGAAEALSLRSSPRSSLAPMTEQAPEIGTVQLTSPAVSHGAARHGGDSGRIWLLLALSAAAAGAVGLLAMVIWSL